MAKIKSWIKLNLYRAIPFSYVFMFHHVSENPKVEKSSCKIGFDEFKKLIERYKGNYVSIFDVAQKKSKRKIAVTFDDGLSDLYTLAYPFLKEQGIPFTAFIITDFLDTEGYITTEQLKEMSSDPLVTIGSHGVTHKTFPSLDKQSKLFELSESKKILENIIGKDVTIFAYSHGQHDEETLSLMGCYDWAVSASESFSAHFKSNKYLIPRCNMTSQLYKKQIEFFDNVISLKHIAK